MVTSKVKSGPSSRKQRWRRMLPTTAPRAPTMRRGEGERRGYEGLEGEDMGEDSTDDDGLGHIEKGREGW